MQKAKGSLPTELIFKDLRWRESWGERGSSPFHWTPNI